jgi:hypothetical protein
MMATMNQLINEVRGDINEFTQNVWRNTDIVTWLNDGIQAVVSESNEVTEDWYTRRMRSTDSAETIHGESYNPSGLTIVAATDLYTLPPNVLQIRSIDPLTSANHAAGIQFLPRALTDYEVARVRRFTVESPAIYYYTVIGTRTLRIVPTPAALVSITTEMFYVAMPERLTASDTITQIPVQALKAVKAYAVWLAMQAVNSPDVDAKFAIYKSMVQELNTLATPRITSSPAFSHNYRKRRLDWGSEGNES